MGVWALTRRFASERVGEMARAREREDEEEKKCRFVGPKFERKVLKEE